MDSVNGSDRTITELKADGIFKKPILIGKIGRLPRKMVQTTSNEPPAPVENQQKDVIEQNVENSVSKESLIVSENLEIVTDRQTTDNSVPLPYKEPSWSGLPQSNGKHYVFEVLKNGAIIETINLMERSFWVFGRLPSCNISMQHPTISRYHAVLQYRYQSTESDSCGFYIYDLGSTHGTFLNKNRLKPKVYARVQVGHMLKLGCSTRSYILTGPEDDAEQESEFTVTELKQKRAEELLKREEEIREAEKRKEEMRKKEEERGIDWGLGEDADEETDLSENPFAQTTNEELYLDDPKKALRGFFEREGLELEYDCNEQGLGQFLCKVELPLDDELGRPIVAEVLHKGKKKEAVVQCALEACRILDRHGVLRQAIHESRKRKAKNWEENDFYDSDEDTFLDRTGTIEKKREKRMKAKVPEKAETYESLLEKEKSIAATIADLEKRILEAQERSNNDNNSTTEEDTLDSFMKGLKDTKPDKQTLSKLKLELSKMKDEHAKVIRLANIAKPASLPELVPQQPVPSTSTSSDVKSKILPVIGKRRKVKLQLPTRSAVDQSVSSMDVDGEEEEEEDEEKVAENEHEDEKPVSNTETRTSEEQNSGNTALEVEVNSGSSSNSSDEDLTETDKHQEKLEKILNNLKKLAANEDRMHVDWKMLAAKKRKVMKLISDLRHCEPNEKLEHKVSSELNRLLTELNIMTEQKYKVIDEVKKMGNEIKNISEAIDKDFKAYKKGMSKSVGEDTEACTSSTTTISSVSEKSEPTSTSRSTSIEEDTESDVADLDERKKKKNQRRIQHRQEKAELERQRGYEEDATREDYNMWVPPSDQTGDGRTSLNDKLGY
ncbi:kanadaptin isoform X2 [Anoplophora glabripennis]|uniref:kanadaptin isoform X2 n=1 Tax=Anoplophora glabripennis TaxID=217634 RepID=UPI0008759177|nr:kanadaptin isoform X2 [Anoplophora glabripennis]